MITLPSLLVLLSILCAALASAQPNLVPNPSFELSSEKPQQPGEWDKAVGWSNLNGVAPYRWPYGSPDYLRTDAEGEVKLPNCVFGDVDPHTGAAIMGFVAVTDNSTDYREYISTQLAAPMVPGNLYDVEFYICNGMQQGGRYGGDGCNGLGILLSTSQPNQENHEPLPVLPQWQMDTVFFSHGWQRIHFQILADSAYSYITIGNFRTDAETARREFYPASASKSSYFFLDDVYVALVQSACKD